ncbi:glycosyltransferase family 2 protein [Azomonas macrocytogenes]|uniref:Glycosyl transferase family 2 n=1 Tax=Azomonas macrocytogenes TaxID=69962 RepID=A0A839SYN5_AZOMA|nr:glycosyltransferase family 2 protein [Azomonas macrocytogenes]MBB3102457.1 hypothetical protein [Azomonas macrocytogenes]
MRIACLMMQKNEIDLLEKWIIHHGDIFGFENLYIFDNGSTDEKIKIISNEFTKKGVNFFFDFNTPTDFENKGKIIGRKIIELDSKEKYDFFIPLDCDEFVGVLNANGEYSCQREDIDKELAYHIKSEDVLLFKWQCFNSPINKNSFQIQSTRKCFFRSKTFDSMDVGFHWGKSRLSGGEHHTSLIQFHFHNKPFEILREHAKEKLKLRVKSFEPDSLKNYDGPGLHMIKYFLATEKDYLSEFTKISHQKINCLEKRFKKLGLAWPYESYLVAAQDIFSEDYSRLEALAKAFGLQPLTSSHEYVKGNIDHISLQNQTLRLSGWGADNLGNTLKHFRIVINNEALIIIKDIKTINRPDVIKHHANLEINCGFELEIPTTKIMSFTSTIKDIKIYATQNHTSLGNSIHLGQEALLNLKSLTY